MRRWIVGLTLLGLAAGCGGDGGTEPVTLTPDAVVGTWALQRTQPTGDGCTEPVADGPLYLHISAPPARTSAMYSLAETWDVQLPVRGNWSASGQMRFPEGTVDLRLWRSVLVSGSQLTGTMQVDGTFSGTLTDPIPGAAAQFSSGACTWTVTGQKQ